MKKIKSKKGFTLVELVVTIAILSITASMGASIFIMTLNNYGEASRASFDQQQAVALEEIVREYCKATKEATYESGTKPTLDKASTCFYTTSDGTIYVEHYDKTDGTITKFSVTGIQSFSTKYLKRTSAQNSSAGYVIMQYTIVTNNGFELTGAIVLNNSNNSSCASLTNCTLEANTTAYLLFT